MATSTFPSVTTGVTVELATNSALSGDGSSGNKLKATGTFVGVVTGTDFVATSMPTSDPGVAGKLYSTAGVVHISAG